MQIAIIQKKIYEFRGHRIMLDFELSALFGTTTKSLNLAVKRNRSRFPEDFMFQLTKKEWESLRFQIETSNRGGRRYMPYAFTEHGVTMLANLLKSETAFKHEHCGCPGLYYAPANGGSIQKSGGKD
jgi:hypothetical protein